MAAPAAVTAILARVTELSSEPLAVHRLRDRFDAARAESPELAPRVANPATSIATNVPAATISQAEVVLPAPTGVWVDRVPNERGKALAPAIGAAADRYGLDPAFLAAVFWTESAYTPDVVSRTGAIGLGQLMPETADWLGVDPWDPVQNIDGSARLYRYFLDRNGGDIDLAIASYAAGPGAVKRAGGVPDQFTANYITKLLARTDYLAGRRSTPP